jgi:ATP-dependent Clp protease ATP-binding subunit ClpA
MSMWEPFSEPARRSIVLAQEAAQRLGNNFIGVEHIVLGVVDLGDNIAVEAFASFGFTAQDVSEAAQRTLGRGTAVPQEMVFTPAAKHLIEGAFEESRRLHHNYIGVEHLMLSYTQMDPENRSLLNALGIDSGALRAKLVELLPKWLIESGPQPKPSSHAATHPDLLNNLLQRITALDRPGLESAVERVSGKRLYYTDTEEFWKQLQACVARRDVIGSLMYGLFIDRREGRTAEDTFRELVKRMEENFTR